MNNFDHLRGKKLTVAEFRAVRASIDRNIAHIKKLEAEEAEEERQEMESLQKAKK